MRDAGFRDPQVQNFGSSRNIAIRLPPEPKVSNQEIARAPGGRAAAGRQIRARTVQQLEVVGPQVGRRARDAAPPGRSVFTLLCIFIYIAFRFHTWRLSLGAILAVLHDPILVLGWFAASQTSFDLPWSRPSWRSSAIR